MNRAEYEALTDFSKPGDAQVRIFILCLKYNHEGTLGYIELDDDDYIFMEKFLNKYVFKNKKFPDYDTLLSKLWNYVPYKIESDVTEITLK